MKINKLTLDRGTIPQTLTLIPQPPKELFVIGDLERLLSQPVLAVVGSRRITPYGKAVTYDIVRSLATKGIVIASGLAYGVDAAAHQAALESAGATIAVLPAGLDAIYPSAHRGLAETIVRQGGALVSEYPAGTPPLRQHFIARNRIVSGLAKGVLITEAAAKSGTMHTANFALNQGKDVFAVPGNITNASSEGTNNLIKQGAIPVTEARDILNAWGIAQETASANTLYADTPEELAILELIQSGVATTDLLLHESSLSPETFNQALTMLEINGRIKSLGGQWSLIR